VTEHPSDTATVELLLKSFIIIMPERLVRHTEELDQQSPSFSSSTEWSAGDG
jgi:hypothetical protein